MFPSRNLVLAAVSLLSVCLNHRAFAGGSGLNTVVVVNQNSTNSVELGNYYAERRQVPPQNYLRINWPGGNVEWSTADFDTYLLNPLLAMLSSRQLTAQIDFVVLSMDIPYRVYQTAPTTNSGANSTTAAVFYGFKPDYPASPAYNPASCNLPTSSESSYAGSESAFHLNPPATAVTNSFLTMMITSSNLAQAKAIIDQGVASDGTLPSQTVILGKSSDWARNIRYWTFDNAIFDTRLRGNYSIIRNTSEQPLGFTNLLGYENGMYQFQISPNTFVPGAMADSLTSYGGLIYEPNDHTTLLAFLNAGASASYGTIIEPCGYLEKFPSPQTYFYQARGFSLAESYYQSLTNPYQGLLVGEPLAAPFALAPRASWDNLSPGAMLGGATNLSLRCHAVDANHPIQQVDLFLDDAFVQTVTNIPPLENNTLSATIGGNAMSYTVPAGASLASIATGLCAVLNAPANTNLTKVIATPHGDRIELQCFDRSKRATQLPLSASSSIGSAPALTTFVTPSAAGFLDTVATGIRGFQVSGAPATGSYLQLLVHKTNGPPVGVSVTNSSGTMTLFQMTQVLISTLNSTVALQGPDGLNGQDVIDITQGGPVPSTIFNLLANSPGWDAAQIQAQLFTSTDLTPSPADSETMEDNLADLQPRAHLYLTAGVTNLPAVIPLNTVLFANGSHQLTAVVYEGSHVRTQGRVSQNVVISNAPLLATFTTLLGGSNTALEATLQFSVAANTGTVTNIELFSTGGSLGQVANQSSATFAVLAASLGIGLHPFYALVSAATGAQYRTETKWIRIIGPEPPLVVSVTAPPPRLSWPATAGRSYDVLKTTNLATAFQLQNSLTPSNSTAAWTDTNSLGAKAFYRVRTSN